MKFRFSGHESFPCRYTWLPKAYQAISTDPEIFSNDNAAMVTLGVGKNMVKSIRFWIQAFGIAKPATGQPGLEPTELGHLIFGPDGFDPFLEDTQTLWLLHYKLSSIKDDPLFAWYFLLYRWSKPQFSRSEVLSQFTKESEQMERPLADFTKDQHFDIFLHSYVPVRSKKTNEVLEDSLDCPLNELQFILPGGERLSDDGGRLEPLYEFNNENGQQISDQLFVYCLFDNWRNFHAAEQTISFREISSSPCSIGQVFRLNEPELRNRLEHISAVSAGLFEFVSSASVPRLIKTGEFSDQTQQTLLNTMYRNIAV
ncbi:Protein of unknown function [Mucilaginibacter pineti]|uniref:DUF4007 domain-containing protein n=1 Tax=Mucilaginibacter pineti TaxID=1391627 RepID=A0A1G7IJZ2_9SPHI|nr:DUF4007 family protein [Mucilaginibacter pineti]SDF13057.1 Protein of unknown function [Mucilaginibacter pineti]